jgi:multicomponent Na+:H+ antiporter subunit B
VVLASGAILILLGCQSHRIDGLLSSEILSIVETAAYLLFILVGIAGIVSAGYFLASPFKGSLPWMMYILNMIIGIKVGAGVGLICLAILHHS